ncbi:hypothetical protein RCL1_000260 [Eukaryota sp. TZLM3-RCL]
MSSEPDTPFSSFQKVYAETSLHTSISPYSARTRSSTASRYASASPCPSPSPSPSPVPHYERPRGKVNLYYPHKYIRWQDFVPPGTTPEIDKNLYKPRTRKVNGVLKLELEVVGQRSPPSAVVKQQETSKKAGPKPVEIPAGEGTPLGELSCSEGLLFLGEASSTIVELHFLLFGRRAKNLPIISNLLLFRGLPKGDNESDEAAIKRLATEIQKIHTLSMIRTFCSLLGVGNERKKDKASLKLAAFFLRPSQDLIVEEPQGSSRALPSRKTNNESAHNLTRHNRDSLKPKKKMKRVATDETNDLEINEE